MGEYATCFNCLSVHRRSERRWWKYKGKLTGLTCCPQCEHTTELNMATQARGES